LPDPGCARSFTWHSCGDNSGIIPGAYGPSVMPGIPAPAHQVSIARNGRFMLPTCTCGWIGTARLTEAAAREEARDHALLYADSGVSADQIRVLVVSDPVEPDPGA
jgi:hypothetical protein